MDSDANDALIQLVDLGSEVNYFTELRNTERPDIERMRYLAIERLLEMMGEALKRALAAEPSPSSVPIATTPATGTTLAESDESERKDAHGAA